MSKIEFDVDRFIQAASEIRDKREITEIKSDLAIYGIDGFIKQSTERLNRLIHSNIKPTVSDLVNLKYCLNYMSVYKNDIDACLTVILYADRILRRIEKRGGTDD